MDAIRIELNFILKGLILYNLQMEMNRRNNNQNESLLIEMMHKL